MRGLAALAVVAVLATGAAPAAAQNEGTGTILGTVFDAASAAPVEGISVVAGLDTEGYFTEIARTTTAADGTYRLEVEDTDSYFGGGAVVVTFRDERGIEFPYVETFYGDVSGDSFGTRLYIEAGETVADIDGRLSRSGELAGRLVDAVSGAPAADVLLRALPDGLCCLGEARAITDADGRYRLTGLLPGRYALVAADDSFPDPSNPARYAEEWSGGTDRALEAELVEVVPQARRDVPEFTLNRTASLAGRVTGSAIDVPAAPVCALAYDQRHRNSPDAHYGGFVDPDTGTWRIDGLAAGSYRVEFRRCQEGGLLYEPEAVAAPVWQGGAATYEEAEPIALAPGEIRDDLVQDVVAGGAATGRVRGPDGAAVPFACVTAVDESNRVVGVVLTEPEGDAAGSFALAGLPPGAYRVRVSDGCSEAGEPFGRPSYAPTWAGGSGPDDAASVEVVRGASTDVGEIRLVDEAAILDVELSGPAGELGNDACTELEGTGLDRPPSVRGAFPRLEAVRPGQVTLAVTDCNVDAPTSPAPASVEIDASAGDRVPVRVDIGDRVQRLEGATRIETAARLSAEFDAAQAVVLARADAYPDALAGAPLAAFVGGPLLLTGSEALADAVRAELDRLRPEVVYLLGGTAALSPAVESELAGRGIRVVRLAGGDRFDTARLVAERLGSRQAYVVEGSNADPSRGWPDAVAVAGLAAAQRRPVLLVTRDEVPGATRATLDEVDEATVVGGSAAVSLQVESEVAGVVDRVDRVAGATRYDTSAALVSRAGSAGLDPARVWLATGANWPDALAAGPAAAADGASLLLVDGADPLGSPVTLALLGPGSTRVVLVGSDDVLARRVEADVRDRLRDAQARCSVPLAPLPQDRLPCVRPAGG